MLFAYGPPWDFGKLLGLYVVFFFVTSQVISWLIFKQALAAVVGGLFIVVDGMIISVAKIMVCPTSFRCRLDQILMRPSRLSYC